MIIAFIGSIVVILLANRFYYDYHVPKKTNDMEMFETWLQRKLNKRYKQ